MDSKAEPKFFALSVERYNGGIKNKRIHGSSTITIFLVGVEGSAAETWQKIKGYGKTPGHRKTDAIESYKKMTTGCQLGT